ncbi:hypothetical protein CEXT_240961 [Caerostris extrusa]|uniref:Uncharacterized protein n=1 Tax=Caerostris extrusa TaxID=172846 RepID=A0AAV4PPT5_CAEEX|nr:hypothetical protein CEXT_240961 [Caerostris extrusa]
MTETMVDTFSDETCRPQDICIELLLASPDNLQDMINHFDESHLDFSMQISYCWCGKISITSNHGHQKNLDSINFVSTSPK